MEPRQPSLLNRRELKLYFERFMTYRAKEAFMAVRDDPPRAFTFVTIPPGAIIVVEGEVLQSGLVNVLYDGQIFGVFMRDIDARAEIVGL